MHVLGAMILVLVVLWFGFQAVDRLGLATQQAPATVTGKTHRAAGQTYTTTIINKQTHVVPHATAEAYVLDLDLFGARAQGMADRALYDGVKAGDRVNVSYRKRRFTGGLEVVAVSR